MLELQTKQEKVYLSALVLSAIILIFVIMFIWNNCPKCDETYSRKPTQPVIVYKIG